MSLEKSRKHLKKYNLDDNIIILSSSSATVMDASESLGVTPGEIAKSLSFIVSGKPILIVASGSARIDNAKFKNTFKKKANMIKGERVEELIGHAVGGVCPFGVNDGVDVYLDESLKQYDVVYPASGSSNSCVKLTIKELERASNYKNWVDVTK